MTTTTTQQQASFTISSDLQEQYPDLIELIKGSASMHDEERQYWFSILPIMTKDQIDRLRGILTNEKEKLATIDEKYQKQLQHINEKHLLEWQSITMKEKREKIQRAENQVKSEEKEEVDTLLGQLDSL